MSVSDTYGANPLGIDDRQRVDGPLRGGHLSHLEQPRADDGVCRCQELSVGKLLLQKSQLRFAAPQLGLDLGDVFLAWAGQGQL